jgi:hypothetical protein
LNFENFKSYSLLLSGKENKSREGVSAKRSERSPSLLEKPWVRKEDVNDLVNKKETVGERINGGCLHGGGGTLLCPGPGC